MIAKNKITLPMGLAFLASFLIEGNCKSALVGSGNDTVPVRNNASVSLLRSTSAGQGLGNVSQPLFQQDVDNQTGLALQIQKLEQEIETRRSSCNLYLSSAELELTLLRRIKEDRPPQSGISPELTSSSPGNENPDVIQDSTLEKLHLQLRNLRLDIQSLLGAENATREQPRETGSQQQRDDELPYQSTESSLNQDTVNEPSVNITHSILQLTQDQMNLHIRHLEREMQLRQNKNDADYAARERELERLKAERRQRSEQRQNEMKVSLQRVTQDNRDYYQRQPRQIDDEIREIERERQSMTEMLNRRRTESEAQHQRLIEQIRLDNERLRREQEEANRCKGMRWFDCASNIPEIAQILG